MWANISQRNFLCNVGPWLTDNLSKQNNLCNVVPIKLGQHCLGISYTQCCPDTSETILQKKITCVILSLRAQACFCRKIIYLVLFWSAWTNIAQNNDLRNAEKVGPQSIV